MNFPLGILFFSPKTATRFLLAVGICCACSCGRNPASVARDREEPRREAVVQSEGNAGGYDLARDEARGGHTLAKHVGQTDSQLAERLRRERNITAASTWSDLATAEETVAAALRANHERIDGWMHRGYPRPNLALHYDAGHAIGRSLRRGAARPVECTGAVIVLRAEGPESNYVLTAYPEDRE